MSEQYNYVATLDITQVLAAFDKVDKRADKTADNATKAFKRIGESKEAAKATSEIEKETAKYDATLKKLIATELRAAAGTDKLTKDFISLTASQSASSAAFINAVSQTDRLSQSQVQFAVKVATTKAKIAELTRELSKEGADVQVLNQQIGRLQGTLNAFDDAQERAAAAAQHATEQFRRQAAEIQKQKPAAQGATKAVTEGSTKGTAALGVMAGAAAAVTNALINMGRRGIQEFKRIIESSVQTAIKFESVERSFQAIFGDPSVADAVFDRVQQRSAELGVDLTQISRKFLPLVGSVEQALKFGELAASLALFDPEQGVTGALISLQELAVGDVVSLRKRFELPTDRIQQFQKELGNVDGALVGLGELLEQRGVSIEQLGDIGQITFARMKINLQQLGGAFGEPILDKLNEQIKTLNLFIEENRDEIHLLVSAFGDVIGAVVELAGVNAGEFITNLDFEGLISTLQDWRDAIDAIGIAFNYLRDTKVGEILFGIKRGSDEGVGGLINLKEASKGLIGVIAIIETAVKGTQESLAQLAILGQKVLSGQIKSFDDYKEAVREGANATKFAFVDQIQEALDKMAEIDKAAEENRQSFADRREEMERSGEADLEAADAILELKNAVLELEAANATLAEETAKANEKISELKRDAREDELEAEVDFQRKLLDIERDAGQDRIDTLRKYLDDLAEARIDYQEDLEDAGIALTRKEEDIARKEADAQFDLAEKAAKKRLDLEEDFQDKLAAIRRKFDFQAQEAIRDNDAVRLLEIRRRTEFELNEARIERDQKQQEEDDDEQERISQAARNAERERREAQIANDRKLEDLARDLQRELAERRRGLDQELRDIRIAELRKREEAKIAFDETIEDIGRQQKYKLEQLKDSLDEEVRAVQDAEQRKAAAAVAGIQQRIQAQVKGLQTIQGLLNQAGGPLASSFLNPLVGGLGSLVPGGQKPGGGKGTGRKRQIGGPVYQGEPVLVGEPLPGGRPNPEIFIPPTSGYIKPLLLSPNTMPGIGTQVFDNSRSLSATVSIPDPNALSPIQKAEVVRLATEILVEANR